MEQGRPATLRPHQVYRDDGWISWPDWLEYKGVTQYKDMLPFAVARAIVRKLELESKKEWQEWSKSGQRPSNIPSSPDKVYCDDGWISYPDWLGYARWAPKKTQQAKPAKKTAAFLPPPVDNTNGGQSRKRARAASDSNSGSDDDTLRDSSGPPQTKIKVEMFDGFSIMSAASDLKHTARGLAWQGAPTS